MKKILINVNSYQIEYIELGKQNKTTIAFAHGLGGNVDQWTDQIKYFSKSYHVVAFSLQGHGGSSKPQAQGHYTISEYSNTVISLLDKLGIENCIWIGNSMGGVIGFEILKKSPERINLICTNGTTPQLIMPRFAIKFIYFSDILLQKAMGFAGYIRFAVRHISGSKSVQERLFKIMIQTSPRAIIASHVMLGNYSYIETVKNSAVPVIIIKAAADSDINKYLKKQDKLLKQCSKLTIIEFENAGHLANLDQPLKYNNLIEEIINKYID